MTSQGGQVIAEATEATLSETVELFHYQSAASRSSLLGGGGGDAIERIRSTPTRLPSSSKSSPSSRRDPPGAVMREPSKQDFLMLKKLVESSTKELQQQQQKERDTEALLRKQTSPSKTKKSRGAMKNKNKKKQQKQLKEQNTPTTSTVYYSSTAGTSSAKKEKKKPWFLRMFGRKSRVVSNKQIAENVNAEQEASTMITTPASSQAPSPEKQKTGKQGIKKTPTRSSASVASSSHYSRRSGSTSQPLPPPPESSRPSRSGTRSRSSASSHASRTSRSSRASKMSSTSHANSSSNSNAEHDQHAESIVQALAKRLKEMEAFTSTGVGTPGTAAAAVARSAANSSSGDGYFPGEQRVNMSPLPSEAPNSLAVTQPVDNRETMIQNRIPPAVKTVPSPSAVSSLAHEQPSRSPSNPALGSSNVDNARLLSTLEETDGDNLEQVLSMPSNCGSLPPPVEVTLSPDQHQQSLGLSLSASYSGDDKDNDDNETRDAKAEKIQQKQEQHVRKTTREIVSSTLSAAKKVLERQKQKQQQEQDQESSGKKAILQPTVPGDPSQEVVADVSWSSSPPVLGDAESAAKGIEAPVSTAETTNDSAPVEPIKNSIENNYMRLVQDRQSSKASPKQDKAVVPKATSSAVTTADPPPPAPLKKSERPPRPTQSSNRSSSSSTSSAAKALGTSLSSTERASGLDGDEPEQMQQPRPDKARGSSQPPPPTRRSRIVDSKLLVSEVEEGHGIEIEASILDIPTHSVTSDQQHQSPDTSTESMEAAVESDAHDEASDGACATSDSDAATKTSTDAPVKRRTRDLDGMQRKHRQAAMKLSEEGGDGWGLHDEPRLDSNATSWDPSSYNRPPRASRRKSASRHPKAAKKASEPVVTSKQQQDATSPAAKVTPPTKARSKSKSKRKSRSKRRRSGERMDDDFFSDTDSDNRPEQDLPLLMKKLVNQKIQKTVSMISREFKMTMSYQEDPLNDSVVAPVDSEFSSDDDDDYETGAEVETDVDEEDESSTTSHTYSYREDGTVSSSSRADESFFAGEEKKEVDSADLIGSSTMMIARQSCPWSTASLGMDYVCGPSREEILSMSGDSDA